MVRIHDKKNFKRYIRPLFETMAIFNHYLHWYDQQLPVAPLSRMRNIGLINIQNEWNIKYSPHWIAMVKSMSHQSVLKIQVQEHQWTTLRADPSSITNRSEKLINPLISMCHQLCHLHVQSRILQKLSNFFVALFGQQVWSIRLQTMEMTWWRNNLFFFSFLHTQFSNKFQWKWFF